MNFKKIKAACIALTLVASLTLPNAENFYFKDLFQNNVVHAEVFEGLTYKIENGGIVITAADKSITKITIPKEIDSIPVVTIGKAAFMDCTKLETIVFEEGLKYI